MKKCTRFVGLDNSKDSIDVALASEGRAAHWFQVLRLTEEPDRPVFLR